MPCHFPLLCVSLCEYNMLGVYRFVYASVARLAVLKFVNYMNASADVLALASIEVPIAGIPDGGCIVVK